MEESEWSMIRTKVKEEWRRMWIERIDDKDRAEGIAQHDYEMLSINKGTVIFASRDAEIPNIHQILKRRIPRHHQNNINPNPTVGGWRRFIKKDMKQALLLSNNRDLTARTLQSPQHNRQQLKKGGRGWCHSSKRVL